MIKKTGRDLARQRKNFLIFFRIVVNDMNSEGVKPMISFIKRRKFPNCVFF